MDEDGILNFSDWAPENSNVEVARLIVSNANPPAYDPSEDQNSILEQTERMNVRWAQLNEQQEERRKQRLELEEQQRPVGKSWNTIIPVTTAHTSTIDPYTDPDSASGEPLKCKIVSLASWISWG